MIYRSESPHLSSVVTCINTFFENEAVLDLN